MAEKQGSFRFSINVESPIAVYVQIENQVQFAIAAGRYKSGDALPSVRDMSEMLDVNPNTVTKAYRDLEMLGIVHTRRGVGVTVAAKAPKLCLKTTREMVTSHLRDAVAEGLSCGMAGSEIRKIVTGAIDSRLAPYTS
jgi:GntR family transcriptional regulator